MPRLTNAQLEAKAHEYRLAKGTERTAKAKAKTLSEEILAELDRRKKPTLTVGGLVITKKAKRYRRFAIDLLKKRLHPAVYAEVVPPTVAVRAFDDAVKLGRIPDDVAEAAVLGFDESAPYIDVDVVG
jgi:hypothetical protein